MAFDNNKLGELRPNQIVAHHVELENAMNEALSEKWGELRGLKVVSIALGSVTLPPEDVEMIKELQRTAALQNPTMAGAHLVSAQADAMKAAAANEAGAMTGFMGMGMAMNAGAGMNAQNLFAMGHKQQEQVQQTPQMQPATVEGSWRCECGTENTGKFCTECGKPKPAASGQWLCFCGTVNAGKFCTECGKPRP